MSRDLADFPRPVLTALAAAERLLTRRAGATVVLADPEDLGGSERSVVARARVARNPFSLPRTLVVKHYLGDPDPRRPDPFHFEVASCQLFTALPVDARPSPVLIAHDPQARLLVLEDLGRSSTLADTLFGTDAVAAQRCLLSWARALGRMQAATAGRENDFGALLRRLGERVRRDPVADDARAAFGGVPDLLAGTLDVTVPAKAEQEARETARLLGGTRFRAFSPSDTCPDNNLVTSRGVRFVDFEWGCFRDVALDAAYFRVPFPACESSFALPAGLADSMLEAWRNEIAAVWQAAAGRAAVVGLAVHLVAAAADRGEGHPDRLRPGPLPADQRGARGLLARARGGRRGGRPSRDRRARRRRGRGTAPPVRDRGGRQSPRVPGVPVRLTSRTEERAEKLPPKVFA
jgi:hypothetical protein